MELSTPVPSGLKHAMARVDTRIRDGRRLVSLGGFGGEVFAVVAKQPPRWRPPRLADGRGEEPLYALYTENGFPHPSAPTFQPMGELAKALLAGGWSERDLVTASGNELASLASMMRGTRTARAKRAGFRQDNSDIGNYLGEE